MQVQNIELFITHKMKFLCGLEQGMSGFTHFLVHNLLFQNSGAQDKRTNIFYPCRLLPLKLGQTWWSLVDIVA